MTLPTTVILADDHALVRDVLANWLDAQPDMKVVAACGNAEEAVAAVKRLQPDVVLMDIDMPGLLAFDAARIIRGQSPDTRIIFLSAFFNDCYIEQALAVQAAGYLTKGEAVDSVVKAIRDVCLGKVCFSPVVQERIVIDSSGARLANQPCTRSTTLSDRELDLLRLLARAMPRKAIALAMNISINTVDSHTKSVMRKLNIHNRSELCRFAIREGLAEA